MHTIGVKKIIMLKPEDIKLAPFKPRKYFDRDSLEMLTKSVSSIGIIQPLLVRKTHKGKFQLISGEQRLRAATLLGLRRVPCILHNINEQQAIIYSIADNSLRIPLNSYEEAKSINRLINYYGVTKSQLTANLGLKHSSLAKILNRLRLDGEIFEKIILSSLSYEYADLLTEIPDFMREEILEKIINKKLSIKQTQDYIKQLLYQNPETTKPCEPPPCTHKKDEGPTVKYSIADTRFFYNSLNKLVETLKNSGLNAHTQKHDTKKYTEYKVRIYKDCSENQPPEQLKIC